MDATGQIGAIPQPEDHALRRGLPLRLLALGGSAVAWMTMLAIIISVVVWNARDAVRDETESAFRLANAAATARLPTTFVRSDLMAEAARLAIEIRGQRHVTAVLRDARGQPVEMPPAAAPEDPAPEWFAALLRPEPTRDLIPITQYPNVLGVLEISTKPSDEIAEVWQDLSGLLPLLLVTSLVAIGMTMAITGLLLRRLGLLAGALDRMRAGDLQERAPRTGLAELNGLTDGVNALAAHLAHERAQNRRLQARMMTLAEAERARIASDLHDEIGPQLFALQAAVGQAARFPAAPEQADALGAVARHADAIRKSARAAIDDLRLSPAEGAGIAEMLQELVLEFDDIAPGTRFDFALQTDFDEPDEAGQIALYRFVRESTLNALRHGAPSYIAISLGSQPGPTGNALVARVSDDGQGPQAGGRRGLGQAGMRDRAAALGAEWQPPRREGALTITEFRIAQP